MLGGVTPFCLLLATTTRCFRRTITIGCCLAVRFEVAHAIHAAVHPYFVTDAAVLCALLLVMACRAMLKGDDEEEEEEEQEAGGEEGSKKKKAKSRQADEEDDGAGVWLLIISFLES